MSSLLQNLKVKFPDLYELLSKNQGTNGLIFFVPKPRFYQKELLADKNFYYSHIFQKSKFDESLYVNLFGKVLKSIDGNKKFFSFLRWTTEISFNIKSIGTNEDNILYYITDGICIEELAPSLSTNEKNAELPLEIEKFNTAEEYLNYYGKESFGKNNKKYNKAKSILEKFINAMKFNNVLVKGQECSYSKMFQENAKNLIYIFTNVFKNEELIAQEYVDVFVYKELYDIILNKIKDFYKDENEMFYSSLNTNLTMFTPEELKLPKNIEKCNFSGIISCMKNLENLKTSFEKYQFLVEIHNKLIEEIKGVFEKEDEGLEDKVDFMKNCWIYFITHINKNDEEVIKSLIWQSLFFKYLLIRKNESRDDYAINCFISSIEYLQNEVLKKDLVEINGQIVRPYNIKTSD